jgi:hypothetical protein
MCKVPIPPIVDVDVENLVITPYCGPKNMWPSLKITTYTSFQNLSLGNFISEACKSGNISYVDGKGKECGCEGWTLWKSSYSMMGIN